VTVAAATLERRAAETSRKRTLTELVEAAGHRTLLLGSSKDPNAKVTMLLLPPTGDAPLFAVKVPTTAAAERAVEAEVSALRVLHGNGLGVVGDTIPHVVELVEHRGRTALVTNALSGVPLSRLYAERGHIGSARLVARDFAVVGEWLRRFQDATASEPAPETGTRIADVIRDRFADDPGAAAGAVQVAELEAKVSAQAQIGTAVHGDFWFGNVLVRDDRVTGVVDWEAAAPCGDPTRDVVRFALSYALYLDRRTRRGKRVRGHDELVAGRWGVGVELAFDGSGWFPELFRGFVRDGLAHTGAEPADWREHVLVGIAEVAASADDPAFAARHLELFRRLARRTVWRAPE
jgi:aminoglycoside phosphotransferase